MSRRVIFRQLGTSPDVLEVVEVEPPHPGPGEVRVHVQAAGLNPLDHKIFTGSPTSNPHNPEFPSGNGNDFTGVVDELGEGVTTWGLGDEVLGGKLRGSQADFVIVSAERLVLRPAGLEVEQAGSLSVVARTAAASVASLNLTAEDVVFVSAAAGGVGQLAVQLARRAGATVIGSASSENHEFLRSLGVHPVEYGPGLVDAVRAIAPDGITAALDNHGRESVDAALALGASANRVNSIADYTAAAEYGTTAVGSTAARNTQVAEIAQLIAAGEMVFSIDSIFPIERVQDAYRKLMAGHVRGKIVLLL